MWKARVLVLNASDRHALSIARALAKAGYYVCMGDSNRYSVGFLSRCCHEPVVFPCEARQEEQAVPFLKRCLTDHRIDVILPVDYNWNVLLSKYAREFDGRAAFLAVDYERMRIACTKDLTMRHTASIGLGVPKTYAHPDEIECFPIVVKDTLGTHAVHISTIARNLPLTPSMPRGLCFRTISRETSTVSLDCTGTVNRRRFSCTIGCGRTRPPAAQVLPPRRIMTKH